jgi:hypothetical protein
MCELFSVGWAPDHDAAEADEENEDGEDEDEDEAYDDTDWDTP